jgi:hypothetical protein
MLSLQISKSDCRFGGTHVDFTPTRESKWIQRSCPRTRISSIFTRCADQHFESTIRETTNLSTQRWLKQSEHSSTRREEKQEHENFKAPMTSAFDLLLIYLRIDLSKQNPSNVFFFVDTDKTDVSLLCAWEYKCSVAWRRII